MERKLIGWVFFLYGGILILLLSVSCARYSQAPGGGPKDLIPPMLVSSLPRQGCTDFTGNEIRLAFDEYVVLQGTENIITSPPLTRVSYTSNLKEVLVSVEDTLKPDQTYSINFKDAVGDLHESTPLRNFTFVFSTGRKIDSGRICGVLRDAVDLKPVDGASVMFYSRKPEGFPVTAVPDYVAVSDSGGFFDASYMKEGCYYVLACKEESRNYQVDPTGEKSAFSSRCWHTFPVQDQVLIRKEAGKKESDTGMRLAYDQALVSFRSEAYRRAVDSGYELYAYQDRQDEVFLKEAKWTAKGEIVLDWYFRPEADSLAFSFLPSFSDVELVRQLLQDRADTVPDSKRERKARRNLPEEEVEMPDLDWPSRLRYEVVDQDDPLQTKIYFDDLSLDDLCLVVSNGRFSDTAELSLDKNVAGSKDTAAFRVSARQSNLLFSDSLVLDFSLPMLEGDLEKASLYQYCTDDEGNKDTVCIGTERLEMHRIRPDRISLSYGWQPGCSYLLYLPSACFCDYFGRLPDTALLRFSVPDLLAYGQVALDIRGLDSTSSYVLQMFQVGGKTALLERNLSADGIVELPYVKPALVSFVLFEDRNRNGKWDGGHYPDGLQPEKRWIFPKKLQVEADWRMEEIWTVTSRTFK